MSCENGANEKAPAANKDVFHRWPAGPSTSSANAFSTWSPSSSYRDGPNSPQSLVGMMLAHLVVGCPSDLGALLALGRRDRSAHL
jgi:hypothetical protein